MCTNIVWFYDNVHGALGMEQLTYPELVRSRKAAADLAALLRPVLLQRKKSECKVLRLPRESPAVP